MMERTIFLSVLVVLFGVALSPASPLLISHWNTTQDASYAIGDETAEPVASLPSITTAEQKFGVGSLAFTSEKRMYYDYANNFNPDKGTFELFVNFAAKNGSDRDYMFSVIDGERIFLRREVYSSGKSDRLYAFYDNGSSSNAVYTGWSQTALALNAWHHIAFTWDMTKGVGSNEMAIFIDGTRAAIESDVSVGQWTTGANRIDIGKYGSGGTSNPDCYMDELRISDDVVYQGASYTVPTAEFIPEPATILLLGIGSITLLRRRRG